MSFVRISLEACITATRQARDTNARAAQASRDAGAGPLADELDNIAAQQDRHLAYLLREHARIQAKANLLPGA